MAWNGMSDRPQKGSVSCTVTAAVTGTGSVTFSPAFSATPKITGLVVVGTNAWAASVPSGLSASGMTVGVRRVDGGAATTTTVTVHWAAEV